MKCATSEPLPMHLAFNLKASGELGALLSLPTWGGGSGKGGSEDLRGSIHPPYGDHPALTSL